MWRGDQRGEQVRRVGHVELVAAEALFVLAQRRGRPLDELVELERMVLHVVHNFEPPEEAGLRCAGEHIGDRLR